MVCLAHRLVGPEKLTFFSTGNMFVPALLAVLFGFFIFYFCYFLGTNFLLQFYLDLNQKHIIGGGGEHGIC